MSSSPDTLPTEPSQFPPRGRAVAEVALYIVLAAASTWPLALHLRTRLPVGTEPVATVPLFNAWTLWWNGEWFLWPGGDYWDAPIFHPVPDAFAFSEPQPTTIAAAPITWLFGSPVPAYNLYLLASLVLNGWTARCLLRSAGAGLPAAFFGGAMVEMLPFVHWQLGILQMVPLWGVVWTLHALMRFSQAPGLGRGALLGGALAATYFACNHHGLFLSVLLIAGGGWIVVRWELVSLRGVAGVAVATITTAALMLPVVYKQLSVVQTHDYKRSEELAESLSAEWIDYAVPAWQRGPSVLYPGDEVRRKGWAMSPGMARVLLALVGLVYGMRERRYRRLTLFVATVTACSLVLSMGPKFTVKSWSPFDLLVSYYPGFSQVRNIYRFAVFVHLCVALQAAVGLEAVWSWLVRRQESDDRTEPAAGLPQLSAPRSKVAGLWRTAVPGALRLCANWRWLLPAAVGVLAVVEIWPTAQPLEPEPPVEENRAWIGWLQKNTQTSDAVVCLPFPDGTSAQAYKSQAVWMYMGMYHRRRMVNGYSGFFPERFLERKRPMQDLPGLSRQRKTEVLDGLYRDGVRVFIVARVTFERGVVQADPLLSQRLEWVLGDDLAAVDLYRLTPP